MLQLFVDDHEDRSRTPCCFQILESEPRVRDYMIQAASARLSTVGIILIPKRLSEVLNGFLNSLVVQSDWQSESEELVRLGISGPLL